MDDDGSDAYRSAHSRAMNLAQKLFSGVRHLTAHRHQEDEVDEQLALEQLAAVSVLARGVDDATVATAA